MMILGGSSCQKNALIAAKKLGHEVVLVDYFSAPLAAPLADRHLQISTFDAPACIEAARQNQIDAVFTLGTDQPVLTAATVADALGLPSCISPETALAVTNKKVMKARFAAHGIPAVNYRLIDEAGTLDALAGLSAPYVLKPLDSQGQRGIFRLGTAQEVLAHLPQTLRFSRQRQALVEEYYPADEITVSGWVEAGRLTLLSITDRLTHEDAKHIGICTAHRFPSVHLHYFEEIESLANRLCKAFGIENGPLYVQMLIGAQGIQVNELACRIGGAFEDVLIPHISGFSILRAVIAASLGKQADTTALKDFDMRRTNKQVSVQLLFCRQGEIHSVTPIERLRALPYVLDAGYNYRVGECIPALENATARFGHCVIAGKGDIDKKVDEFYDIFRVTDADNSNLVIKPTR